MPHMKMPLLSPFKFFLPLFSSSRSFIKILTMSSDLLLKIMQRKFSTDSFSSTSMALQLFLQPILAKPWRYFSSLLRFLIKSIISMDSGICMKSSMLNWSYISTSANSIFLSLPLKLLLASPKPTTSFLGTTIMNFCAELSTFFSPGKKCSTKGISVFSGQLCKSWGQR